MTLEQLIALAKEVETEDPIDWSDLSITRDASYVLIGTSILELFEGQATEAVLATLLKVIVENFALNVRIAEFKNNAAE